MHGNLYGTPAVEIEKVLDSGNDILLDIDTQGSSQIKENYHNSVHIFLIPPNLDVLRERLSNRNTEKSEDLKKRMDTAIKEISKIQDYDYIIISEDIEKSLQKLESIIVSVRSKTSSMRDYVFNLYNISNDIR